MSTEALYDLLTRQHLAFLLTGRDTHGELLQAEVRLEGRGRVPRHVHARQDERVEVHRGELIVRVRSREHRLRPGDAIEIPRRKLHVIRNATDEDAVFLLEVRPARRMETMMRTIFRVTGLIGRVLRRPMDKDR